ncbi:TrbI/VirB10 family protein (plasmid) [Pseudomonas viciae]|uniref:TrbI/VirB10 family protein n=1 Tax=Pseudomonas viciae TaxID=2505979 RepID=A0ABY8PMH4_9PSED|nr:TrbI/VirB10 family protein [Pseudomonas viciae]WGO96442.1 TrbI/VirB10 family protein [Pseudomonas viciae]
MTKETITSPDILVGDSANLTGGRRLNRFPLMIGIILGAVVIGVIAYTYNERANPANAPAPTAEADKPEAANATPLFGNAPVAGEIESNWKPTGATPPASTAHVASMPSDGSNVHDSQQVDPAVEASRRAWQAYDAEVLRVETQRRNLAEKALLAETTVDSDSKQGNGGAMQPTTALQGMAGALGQRPGMPSMAGMPSMDGGGEGGYSGLTGLGMEGGDPNKQAAKASWLNSQPSPTSNYLAATREAPLSRYEVKAGTIIPGVMVTGINSDLPGQIVGQVRQNVYDEVSRRRILIPQNARLIGTYDNGVTMGQERVLVAWTRIIYPDGSSVDLGRMPGADQAGYAGFADKVNNHLGKVFTNALLLSVFSAGIQLSQPQAQNGENTNDQQVVASSIGQQMGELGSEMARRGLNIAPTIEIRPGYNFNIMVTKDMILKPWE